MIALFFLVITPGSVHAGSVKLKKINQQIEVTIGGKLFARYRIGGQNPKPYFWPIQAADGTTMSRPINRKGDDHPHHKGLWVAVDQVNHVRFWAERGKIRNVSVKIGNPNASAYWSRALSRYNKLGVGKPLPGGKNYATMQIHNRWLDKKGNLVVNEHTTIRIYPNRMMIYEIVFSNPNIAVTFGDTKEGLLGFRMVNSMREKEGGHIVNADGLKTAKNCWGRPTAWIDYTGPINGKTYGVTLFDHPQNLRPSRYHARDYGLFSINPFGEKAYSRGKYPAKPVTIAPKEELRLKYGVYFHTGDTKSANIPKVRRKFLAVTK